MKTLEQIKNEYAKSKWYDDFNHLLLDDIYHEDIKDINNTFDELLILVQEECLQNASENACMEIGINEIDKQSITNENNIIR